MATWTLAAANHDTARLRRGIQRVGVLGAGTMGSRIAAHFANAGIPALLLDVVLPGQPDRSAAARKGLDAALKQKPTAFFTEQTARLVTPGNFADHLPHLAECDWVLEAVAENLEIKQNLWARVAEVCRPSAVLSTNTSGIPLHAIARDLPSAVRRRFLGTHFFNPPRYLHLLEVIPGPATDPELLDFVSEFADQVLGKGVVRCKDTPNFIANRLGSFLGGTIHQAMAEHDLSIEEVDALTGPLIGMPSSASFRLLDLVGLDVWAAVSRNLYAGVPDDPWRERFVLPPYQAAMMERGWLGDKADQGFYRKSGKGGQKQIDALDWKTLTYQPARKVEFESLTAIQGMRDMPSRLRALLGLHDRVGQFLWRVWSDYLVYAAERVPEIADRIVEVDRAMEWGYAHQLGPFRLWDALGVPTVVERLEREGRAVPENVQHLRSEGTSFYRQEGARREYFHLGRRQYVAVEPRPGVLSLAAAKASHGVVQQNAGASLIDLGDGVLCVEFHGKANALGEEQLNLLRTGLEEATRRFAALLIGNQAEHFSVGANLYSVLALVDAGQWEQLSAGIQAFQQLNLALKYAPVPVVAAPFGRTLGGACELVLHSARAQASAECYMGLVETGVGLIPGAGGCKEVLARGMDPLQAFEMIGMAKVSGSAAEARQMGLLRESDGVSLNPERLIADAKALAVAVAGAYRPPVPAPVPVSGAEGFARMKLAAWSLQMAGYASEHDGVVAEKLAHVLSGGRLSGSPAVPEQYLLDLEREAFLSLCGMAKTQDRMRHTLKTGKPLRN